MKARFDYLFFLLHYSTYHRRTPPLHLLTLSRVSPVSDVRGYVMLQYNTALNLVTYNMHSYLPITLLFTVCFQDLGRCSSSLKSIFLSPRQSRKKTYQPWTGSSGFCSEVANVTFHCQSKASGDAWDVWLVCIITSREVVQNILIFWTHSLPGNHYRNYILRKNALEEAIH